MFATRRRRVAVLISRFFGMTVWRRGLVAAGILSLSFVCRACEDNYSTLRAPCKQSAVSCLDQPASTIGRDREDDADHDEHGADEPVEAVRRQKRQASQVAVAGDDCQDS